VGGARLAVLPELYLPPATVRRQRQASSNSKTRSLAHKDGSAGRFFSGWRAVVFEGGDAWRTSAIKAKLQRILAAGGADVVHWTLRHVKEANRETLATLTHAFADPALNLEDGLRGQLQAASDCLSAADVPLLSPAYIEELLTSHFAPDMSVFSVWSERVLHLHMSRLSADAGSPRAGPPPSLVT